MEIICNLFESATFYNGHVLRLPPKQNEKHGQIWIHIYNGCGFDCVNWKGHELPQNIIEQIRRIEESCGVYNGLFNTIDLENSDFPKW